MTLREEREKIEREILSPHAVRSEASRGRERPEPPCPLRTCFQRDRDRIIHSKAFRRLNYKTQVFIAPESDHYRNRLTHTLEVMQIARNIARALMLNEDLTEAIALAHDLGHTPFGHAGEWALDKAYRTFDAAAHFHHAEQSLRVVDVLEKNGAGLNLTWEVRDGILSHTKGMADLSVDGRNLGGDDAEMPQPATLEGQIVRLADRIAYVNHDADDAIRAGLLGAEDLPAIVNTRLGKSLRSRINTMIVNVVESSLGRPEIVMNEFITEATNELKNFLFEKVYDAIATSEAELQRVEEVISGLFRHYMAHPELLGVEALKGEKSLCARAVCDYIAGMTDRFARSQFIAHFIPRSWPAP
jgi:dGTPase